MLKPEQKFNDRPVLVVKTKLASGMGKYSTKEIYLFLSSNRVQWGCKLFIHTQICSATICGPETMRLGEPVGVHQVRT